MADLVDIPLFIIGHSGSILGVFALSFTIFLLQYAIQSRRPKNFPPGPKGLPIIGNLHQLPLKKFYLRYALVNYITYLIQLLIIYRQTEWSKKYGSIVGFKIGPQNAVVLSDYRHVKE